MANTLTSLAILKVLADRDHRDFLENFIPFVSSILSRRADSYASGFSVPDISKGIADEFGLFIPYHPMRALLERASRRRYVRKEHGKYFVNPSALGEDRLAKSSIEQQTKFRSIEIAFQEFAKAKYDKVYTSAEATNAVLAFLKRNDIDLLIASKNRSILPQIKSNKHTEFIFYDFVSEIYANQRDLYTFLVGLAFGHILASAVVNTEIGDYTGKLRTLNVYLDTRLVLLALGLDSEEYRDAYCELLKILRDQGASLFIFDHTRDEIESILEGCRPHLLRDNVDPDRISRVCLTLRSRGYAGSDLDWEVAQLENALNRLQIEIAPAPDPEAFQLYQINEIKLRNLIVKAFQKSRPQFDEFARGPIIDKDVRSISSIYRLRKGKAPKRLTEAAYIFISTNTSLARAARWFDRVEYERRRKIPTCLTDVFIGTLAWLNLPNQVIRLNDKKLIADCYAAIEPNTELLIRLASEAEKLRKRGQIDYNDYLLVRNDKIARRLLAQKTIGDPDLVGAQAIEDVLAVIKKQLTDEAWRHAHEEEARRVEAEDRYQESQRQMMESSQKLSFNIQRISDRIALCIAVVFAIAVLVGPVIHLLHIKLLLGLSPIFWDFVSVVMLVFAILGFSDFKSVRRRIAKVIFGYLYRWVLNLSS